MTWHGYNSIKIPFGICGDIMTIPEKTSTCNNNPEESYAGQINKYTACFFYFC